MLPIKQTQRNGSSNQHTSPKMLYPAKTTGITVLANHQSNFVSKSNGNISNHSQEIASEKLISSSRRIPRLIRSPNVVDDHNNNNLLNDITSYKLQNGNSGINVSNDSKISNGKDYHLNLVNNSNKQNGQINGNSTKIVRMRNCNILKSPHFGTRVKSEDE